MSQSETLNLLIQSDIAEAIKARLRSDQSMESWLIEHLVSYFGLEERVRRRTKSASNEKPKEQSISEPDSFESLATSFQEHLKKMNQEEKLRREKLIEERNRATRGVAIDPEKFLEALRKVEMPDVSGDRKAGNFPQAPASDAAPEVRLAPPLSVNERRMLAIREKQEREEHKRAEKEQSQGDLVRRTPTLPVRKFPEARKPQEPTS